MNCGTLFVRKTFAKTGTMVSGGGCVDVTGD